MRRAYKHKKANLNKYTQYGINPKFFGRQAARFPKSIKTQYCNIHHEWYPWYEPSNETTFTLRRSPAVDKGTGCIESFNPAPELGPQVMIAETVPPVLGPTDLIQISTAPTLGPTDLDAITAPSLGPLSTSASVVTPQQGASDLNSSIETPQSGPASLSSEVEVSMVENFGLASYPSAIGSTYPVKYGGRFQWDSATGHYKDFNPSGTTYFAQDESDIWVYYGENSDVYPTASTTIQYEMGNGWVFQNFIYS